MSVQYQESGDPEWITVSNIDFPLEAGHQIVDLLEEMKTYAYVAGGAARWLVVEKAPLPGDIDLFLYREKDLSYVTVTLEDMGYEYNSGPPRAPKYKYVGKPHGENHGEFHLLVQLVTPTDEELRVSYGTPLEVLSQFTFYTEQAAVWMGAGGAAGLVSFQGIEDTGAKRLTFNSLANPLLAAYRINKYGQKGYHISMEEIMKLGAAFMEIGPTKYFNVVYDALSMQS